MCVCVRVFGYVCMCPYKYMCLSEQKDFVNFIQKI